MQIGQILQERLLNNERSMSQQESLNSRQRMMLMKGYGSKGDILTNYNPDYQLKICNDLDGCFFGNHPTLAELKNIYGNNTPVMWLMPQLYDLSEYCGCKDKLQGKPLEQCAGVIATEFYYLKTTELMLFFYRFKSGRYGHFYGSVDPLKITTSLRTFIEERACEIERKEQQIREERERESRKTVMSYQEYLELNKICEQIEAEYYMPTRWNKE